MKKLTDIQIETKFQQVKGKLEMLEGYLFAILVAGMPMNTETNLPETVRMIHTEIDQLYNETRKT
jgi:hypothetical protein